MLHLFDWSFLLFHTFLIIFNLFGWVFRKTRPYNLITLLLTAFSWFILGIFYGWGYCFLTDWHWQILCKLNKCPEFYSYIAYLIHRLFTIHINEHLVDIMTVTCFFAALITSASLNIRDVMLHRRCNSS